MTSEPTPMWKQGHFLLDLCPTFTAVSPNRVQYEKPQEKRAAKQSSDASGPQTATVNLPGDSLFSCSGGLCRSLESIIASPTIYSSVFFDSPDPASTTQADIFHHLRRFCDALSRSQTLFAKWAQFLAKAAVTREAGDYDPDNEDNDYDAYGQPKKPKKKVEPLVEITLAVLEHIHDAKAGDLFIFPFCGETPRIAVVTCESIVGNLAFTLTVITTDAVNSKFHNRTPEFVSKLKLQTCFSVKGIAKEKIESEGFWTCVFSVPLQKPRDGTTPPGAKAVYTVWLPWLVSRTYDELLKDNLIFSGQLALYDSRAFEMVIPVDESRRSLLKRAGFATGAIYNGASIGNGLNTATSDKDLIHALKFSLRLSGVEEKVISRLRTLLRYLLIDQCRKEVASAVENDKMTKALFDTKNLSTLAKFPPNACYCVREAIQTASRALARSQDLLTQPFIDKMSTCLLTFSDELKEVERNINLCINGPPTNPPQVLCSPIDKSTTLVPHQAELFPFADALRPSIIDTNQPTGEREPDEHSIVNVNYLKIHAIVRKGRNKEPLPGASPTSQCGGWNCKLVSSIDDALAILDLVVAICEKICVENRPLQRLETAALFIELFTEIIPVPVVTRLTGVGDTCRSSYAKMFSETSSICYDVQIRLLDRLWQCGEFVTWATDKRSLDYSSSQETDYLSLTKLATHGTIAALTDALMRMSVTGAPAGLAPISAHLRPFGVSLGDFALKTANLKNENPLLAMARAAILDYHDLVATKAVPSTDKRRSKHQIIGVINDHWSHIINWNGVKLEVNDAPENAAAAFVSSLTVADGIEEGAAMNLLRTVTGNSIEVSLALGRLRREFQYHHDAYTRFYDLALTDISATYELKPFVAGNFDEGEEVKENVDAEEATIAAPTLMSAASTSATETIVSSGAERVRTEQDILHVPNSKLNTFDNTLNHYEVELLLSYVRAPYVRLPLLMNFLAPESTIEAVKSTALQRILFDSFYELGPFLPVGLVGLSPKTVPAQKNEEHMLATPYGYLLHELLQAPMGNVVSPLIAILDNWANSIDEANENNHDSFFMLCQLAGSTLHALEILQHNASDIRDIAKLQAVMVAKKALLEWITGPVLAVIENIPRYQYDNAEQGNVIRLMFSMLLGHLSPADLTPAIATTLLTNAIELQSALHQTENEPEGSSRIPLRYFSGQHSMRSNLFGYLLEAPEDLRMRILGDVVSSVLGEPSAATAAATLSANEAPKLKKEKWSSAIVDPSATGLFVLMATQPEVASAKRTNTAAKKNVAEAAQRVEIDLNLFRITSHYGKVALVTENIKSNPDVMLVLQSHWGDDYYQNSRYLQCTAIEITENRHWVRLVGETQCDVHHWQLAESRVPIIEMGSAGRQFPEDLAEDGSEEWIRTLLGPLHEMIETAISKQSNRYAYNDDGAYGEEQKEDPVVEDEDEEDDEEMEEEGTEESETDNEQVPADDEKAVDEKENKPEAPTCRAKYHLGPRDPTLAFHVVIVTFNDQRIADIILYRDYQAAHMYEIRNNRHRFYRYLVYTTNAFFCVSKLPEEGTERELKSLPPMNVRWAQGRFNRFLNYATDANQENERGSGSCDIIRHSSHPKNLSLCPERFVSPAELIGILPAALLQAHSFWQDYDGNIRGYPTDPLEGHLLFIRLTSATLQTSSTTSSDETFTTATYSVGDMQSVEALRFAKASRAPKVSERAMLRTQKVSEKDALDEEVDCMRTADDEIGAVADEKGDEPLEHSGNLPLNECDMRLLNLMTAPKGTLLHDIGQLMGSIESLAYVLCWTTNLRSGTDESNVDLIHLTRLRLKFGVKVDGKGVLRIFSLDFPQYYICNERSDRLLRLLRPFPWALVLSDALGTQSLLVPYVGLIRPSCKDDLRCEVRGGFLKYAKPEIQAKYLIYEVHPSQAYLVGPSLLASLYLFAMLSFIRDMEGACQVVKSISLESYTLGKDSDIDEVFGMWMSFIDPTMVACFLKTFIAVPHMLAMRSVEEFPDLTVRYIKSLGHLPPNCFLAPQEELYWLRYTLTRWEKEVVGVESKARTQEQMVYFVCIMKNKLAYLEAQESKNGHQAVKLFGLPVVSGTQFPYYSAYTPQKCKYVLDKAAAYNKEGSQMFLDEQLNRYCCEENSDCKQRQAGCASCAEYNKTQIGSDSTLYLPTQISFIGCKERLNGAEVKQWVHSTLSLYGQQNGGQPSDPSRFNGSASPSPNPVEMSRGPNSFARSYRILIGQTTVRLAATSSNSSRTGRDLVELLFPLCCESFDPNRSLGHLMYYLLHNPQIYSELPKSYCGEEDADNDDTITSTQEILVPIVDMAKAAEKTGTIRYKGKQVALPADTVFIIPPSTSTFEVKFSSLGSSVDSTIPRTSCTSRRWATFDAKDLDLPDESLRKGLIMPELLCQELRSQPLLSVIPQGLLVLKSRTDKGFVPETPELPFSLSHMTDTFAVKFAKRLELDMAAHAKDENSKQVPHIDSISDERSIRHLLNLSATDGGTPDLERNEIMKGLETRLLELESGLVNLRQADVMFCDQATTVAERTVNGLKGSSSERNIKVRLQHRRVCRADAPLDLIFLVSSLLEPKAVENWRSLNPLLSAESALAVESLVVAIALRANRIRHIARALEGTKDLLLLLKKVKTLATPTTSSSATHAPAEVKHSMEALAASISQRADSLADVLSTKRCYIDEKYDFDPRYLVFEFTWCIMLRQRQIDIIKGLYTAATTDRKCMVQQMIMGAGKTTVVGPLLSLLLADSKALVIQVVPPALLDSAYNILRSSFSFVIQKHVSIFESSRSSTESLDLLIAKLQYLKRSQGIILTTPASLKSFFLKLVESLSKLEDAKQEATSDKANDQGLNASLMAKVLNLWREDAVLVMDEVDTILHPLHSELNFPVGARVPIDFAPMRWKFPIHLFDAVFYYYCGRCTVDVKDPLEASATLNVFKAVIDEGLRTRKLQKTPHLVLLDLSFYKKDMRPVLVQWSIQYLRTNHFTGLSTADTTVYLTTKITQASHPEIFSKVNALDKTHIQSLNLIVDWLDTILPHCLQKINRVNFGRYSEAESMRLQSSGQTPPSRLHTAIPFVGKDLPSASSDFAHPDIVIGTTICAYRLEGVYSSMFTKAMTKLTEALTSEPGEVKKRRTNVMYERWIAAAGGKISKSEEEPLSEAVTNSPDGGSPNDTSEASLTNVQLSSLAGSLSGSIARNRQKGAAMGRAKIANLFMTGSNRAGATSSKAQASRTINSTAAIANLDAILKGGTAAAKTSSISSGVDAHAGDSSLLVPALRVAHLAPAHLKENLSRLLRSSPEFIHWHLNESLFPEFMRSQQHKLSSSAQELGGSMLFDKRLGFSGTPSDLLPRELGKCEYELGTDGKLIRTLTSPSHMSHEVISSGWSVRSILDSIAVAHPPYHALIDTGAIITGMSNVQVAAYLLRNGLSGMEGVVFLDESDRKRVLVRATGLVIPLSECGIPKAKRFAFYDQVHTTGIDIDHTPNAMAALTLGKDMVFRDYAQGAYRMRGIGRGQAIHLLIIPEVNDLIESSAKGSTQPTSLDPRSLYLAKVAGWLTVNTIRSEHAQYRQMCMQGMANVWRKEAFYWLLKGFADGKFSHSTESEIKVAGQSSIDPWTLSALSIFKEKQGFPVPASVPVEKQFSQLLADTLEQHSSFVTTTEGRDATSKILHAMTAEDQRKEQHSQLDMEVVQEQEELREVVLEVETVTERKVAAAVSQVYARGDEEALSWPTDILGSIDLASVYFTPLSDFHLHKRGKMPYPPDLRFSRNFYNPSWKGHRRLKNTIFTLEWSPDSSPSAPQPLSNPSSDYATVSHEISKPAITSLVGLLGNVTGEFTSEEARRIVMLAHAKKDPISVNRWRDAIASINAKSPQMLTTEDLLRLLESNLLKEEDPNRCTIAITLDEAQTLRRIIDARNERSPAGPSLRLNVVSDGNKCLAKTVSKNETTGGGIGSINGLGNYQRARAFSCFRFFDGAVDYTDDALSMLLRALHATNVANRKSYFHQTLSARRRVQQAWITSSVAPLLKHLKTPYDLLYLKVLGMAMQRGFNAKGMSLSDAYFAMIGNNNSNRLRPEQIWGGVRFLNINAFGVGVGVNNDRVTLTSTQQDDLVLDTVLTFLIVADSGDLAIAGSEDVSRNERGATLNYTDFVRMLAGITERDSTGAHFDTIANAYSTADNCPSSPQSGPPKSPNPSESAPEVMTIPSYGDSFIGGAFERRAKAAKIEAALAAREVVASMLAVAEELRADQSEKLRASAAEWLNSENPKLITTNADMSLTYHLHGHLPMPKDLRHYDNIVLNRNAKKDPPPHFTPHWTFTDTSFVVADLAPLSIIAKNGDSNDLQRCMMFSFHFRVPRLAEGHDGSLFEDGGDDGGLSVLRYLKEKKKTFLNLVSFNSGYYAFEPEERIITGESSDDDSASDSDDEEGDFDLQEDLGPNGKKWNDLSPKNQLTHAPFYVYRKMDPSPANRIGILVNLKKDFESQHKVVVQEAPRTHKTNDVTAFNGAEISWLKIIRPIEGFVIYSSGLRTHWIRNKIRLTITPEGNLHAISRFVFEEDEVILHTNADAVAARAGSDDTDDDERHELTYEYSPMEELRRNYYSTNASVQMTVGATPAVKKEESTHQQSTVQPNVARPIERIPDPLLERIVASPATYRGQVGAGVRHSVHNDHSGRVISEDSENMLMAWSDGKLEVRPRRAVEDYEFKWQLSRIAAKKIGSRADEVEETNSPLPQHARNLRKPAASTYFRKGEQVIVRMPDQPDKLSLGVILHYFAGVETARVMLKQKEPGNSDTTDDDNDADDDERTISCNTMDLTRLPFVINSAVRCVPQADGGKGFDAKVTSIAPISLIDASIGLRRTLPDGTVSSQTAKMCECYSLAGVKGVDTWRFGFRNNNNRGEYNEPLGGKLPQTVIATLEKALRVGVSPIVQTTLQPSKDADHIASVMGKESFEVQDATEAAAVELLTSGGTFTIDLAKGTMTGKQPPKHMRKPNSDDLEDYVFVLRRDPPLPYIQISDIDAAVDGDVAVNPAKAAPSSLGVDDGRWHTMSIIMNVEEGEGDVEAGEEDTAPVTAVLDGVPMKCTFDGYGLNGDSNISDNDDDDDEGDDDDDVDDDDGDDEDSNGGNDESNDEGDGDGEDDETSQKAADESGGSEEPDSDSDRSEDDEEDDGSKPPKTVAQIQSLTKDDITKKSMLRIDPLSTEVGIFYVADHVASSDRSTLGPYFPLRDLSEFSIRWGHQATVEQAKRVFMQLDTEAGFTGSDPAQLSGQIKAWGCQYCSKNNVTNTASRLQNALCIDCGMVNPYY